MTIRMRKNLTGKNREIESSAVNSEAAIELSANQITLVIALKSSNILGQLVTGKEVHAVIKRSYVMITSD